MARWSAVQLAKHFLSKEHPCERFGQAEKLLLDEKNCGLGIVQDVAQFVRREPDIQRQQNRSRFQNAVIRFQQAVAIGAEEGDAIAGAHCRLAQRSRETPGAFGELRVRKTFVVADDRGSARILLFRVTKKAQRCEWMFMACVAG